MNQFTVKGNIVDIPLRKIYAGAVHVEGTKIRDIEHISDQPDPDGPYITPGFIDSHVHIESSMLVPAEFAKIAVIHGTTGTISDPHEIANVCGIEGVHFMIENGKTVPFKFHFGAPSCVPATVFETAGAAIDADAVNQLLQHEDIFYLSEMMNFPGVLSKDDDVMKKIASANRLGKPVDGHAPGLRGVDAKRYVQAGISTDHECFTAEEALEKLGYGMKILIREGSAAKNFEALIPLLDEHYEHMMFCSDDKHPDSLVDGHINQLCARAVRTGNDVFKILQAACINPVLHYKMKNGLLREGDPADFIVLKDIKNFFVTHAYIEGFLVAENGQSHIKTKTARVINQFDCDQKKVEDFIIPATHDELIPVIEALEGQLITNKLMIPPTIKDGCVISNTEEDILKIVVVNRFSQAPVAKAFIKNFGLKQGALASSVAHDSHNIVAVGVDDESLCKAVNAVIAEEGGVSAVHKNDVLVLSLPVAGLMSVDDGFAVAQSYTRIDQFVKKELGSSLEAPFMTLSFMALLVIPHLKLSDKGLFDGDRFKFIAS